MCLNREKDRLIDGTSLSRSAGSQQGTGDQEQPRMGEST
jgi:hypothetical protein